MRQGPSTSNKTESLQVIHENQLLLVFNFRWTVFPLAKI